MADPVLTVPPVISGDPFVGSTLTAVPGEWSTGVGSNYYWKCGQYPLTAAADGLTCVIPETVGGVLNVPTVGLSVVFHEQQLNEAGSVWLDGGSNPIVVEDDSPPPVVSAVWITPEDVQAYHDWPGEPGARLVECTSAVKVAVERRRSDLDFSAVELVQADIRVGAIRWAGLMFQARGAPSGFTGYDDASTLFDALGAQRAEIMRLIGWRRPVAV